MKTKFNALQITTIIVFICLLGYAVFHFIENDSKKCQVLYKCYNTLDDKTCTYKVKSDLGFEVLNLTITQFSEVCISPRVLG